MVIFSLEDKVKSALNGDKSAMNELVLYFAPTVESIACSFAGKTSMSQSDLVQDGMIGLLSAVHGFDSEQNIKFVTYATTCIRNRILSSVKSHFRKKNIPLNNYVDINDLNVTDFTADPQNILDIQEKIETLNKNFEERLTTLEKDVLTLHIEGHSYNFIADKLSISEKSVDNALQRARRKLREK